MVYETLHVDTILHFVLVFPGQWKICWKQHELFKNSTWKPLVLKIKKKIKRLGITIKFHELPGEGHETKILNYYLSEDQQVEALQVD